MLKSCIFWFKTSFVKDYRCLSPFGVVENTKSNEKFNNDNLQFSKTIYQVNH